MTAVRLLALCLLVALGGLAYWVFGPTPAERLDVLLDERRWPEAEALARDALEDASAEPRADFYRALGIALGRQDEHAEAAEAYRSAYALLPSDPELRRREAIEIVRLGRQHDARGDSDAALARYREAVALAPEIPHGHHALVTSLRGRGDLDEAIAALVAGLEQGPGDTVLRLQLAWLLATHPDPARRDPDRAIEMAYDAFLHDRTPETLDTLAVSLAAAGEYEQAAEFELQAIALAGDDGEPGVGSRRDRLEAFQAKRPYVEAPAPVEP